MRLIAMCKLLCCFAALSCTSLVTDVYGAMLVGETFTYADGNLTGNDPPIGGAWATHSGTTGQVQVSSGKISIVQSTQSEDVNSTFEGGYVLGAGGVVYSGFDLTVADPGVTVADVYFAMFLQGTANFDARVWMTAPTTSGYRLALSNDNSDTDNDGEVKTADLAFGTTYRVVTKYDFSAKQGTIWINPTSEASPSLTATDPGFSDASIAYAFREAAGNTTQVIDNLYVSTSFAGALTGTEVPEPATVGLVLIAGLVMSLRRRRTS